MSADATWPVAVTIGGEGAAPALMNRKAFQKSGESGHPWIVHPATGRVLPWPGEPAVLALAEGPGCFRLDLPAGTDPRPYGPDAPPQADPDDRSAMDSAASPAAGQGGDGVMDRLSALIARRHAEMPEGSYTTHLFEKGKDKIRKKVGEEAVELLLARDEKDVVYESADLVYHLLVLLEAEGLAWADVTAELARRHEG